MWNAKLCSLFTGIGGVLHVVWYMLPDHIYRSYWCSSCDMIHSVSHLQVLVVMSCGMIYCVPFLNVLVVLIMWYNISWSICTVGNCVSHKRT